MTIPIDTVVILRHDHPVPCPLHGSAYLYYARWTGSDWQLMRLDIALGTCARGPELPSFIEATRAWHAGVEFT